MVFRIYALGMPILKEYLKDHYKHCSCAYEYVINHDHLWNTT